MGVSVKHVLEQGPMLRALGKVALSTLRPEKSGSGQPQCPTAWIERDVPSPSRALVRDFVRNVGGDPSAYRDEIPFHLFPQWGLALASRAVSEAAYPMARVMNAGCSAEIRAPLALGEPLHVKARLESIDDDGVRAILTQKIVTSTRSSPDALVATLRAFVPLESRTNGGSQKPARPKKSGAGATLVPRAAREIAFMRLGSSAGRDFAILTGDFNPIHWVAPYAKAAGFRAPILHGFGTFSRTVEALHRRLFSGAVHAISKIDVRFTRPLVLPVSVGVYVEGESVFIGDAPGGIAYLAGTFSRVSERLSA